VKQAVAGYGKATKKQVMLMTQRLLRMTEIPRPDDAADALAIAICHARAATSLLNTERKFDPSQYSTK
jgi:crossover junction endodeoxyribonuclease RuvC